MFNVTAADNGTTPPPPQPAGSLPGLGKDDFLKMLVGQLKNQNPLSPTGDQDFIQQMAAFTTLEQITNMAAANERITEALGASQAVELIGRTVSYLKQDGTTGQGVVEQVTFGEEGPRLTVGGETGIAPSAVSEVR